MNGPTDRRGVLKGGLVAGAALALPGSGLATPAFAVPATASPLAPYQRRVVEIAAREKDRVASHLWRADTVGVADYALPSWRPRLHIVNLEDGSVRSLLTAHGRGSDREHDGWLKHFSNVPGSLATSRGAYLTAEWYTGRYGTSVRLLGLDEDNHTALERAIVMHSAWYVEPTMLDSWGKLGRSEGCFALSSTDFNEALYRLSGGRLLFADRIGEPGPAPADPGAPLPTLASGIDS